MKYNRINFLVVVVSTFLVGCSLNLIEKKEIEDSIIETNIDDNKQFEKEEAVEIVVESEEKEEAIESFTYTPLPEMVISRIDGVSWKKEAPVGLDDLSYVKVLYWGFDDEEHAGELIVHSDVAKEITEIFKELYDAKFPIEKVRLVDEYDANDDLSMDDNNTSAFCFREIAGQKGKLSKHSYGIAIDINPIQNPYVKGDKVSPIAGKEYTDRENIRKGMIIKESVCYKAFKERGWTWGGEWNTLKDYQHFQKQIDLN